MVGSFNIGCSYGTGGMILKHGKRMGGTKAGHVVHGRNGQLPRIGHAAVAGILPVRFGGRDNDPAALARAQNSWAFAALAKYGDTVM